VQAWAATCHHISELVRITGRSPQEVIGNTGAWEHRWKWSPPAGGHGGHGGQGGNQGPDKSRELQGQLDKMRDTVKLFQSQRDAALAKAGKRDRNDDGGAHERDHRDQRQRRGDYGGKNNSSGSGKGNGKGDRDSGRRRR